MGEAMADSGTFDASSRAGWIAAFPNPVLVFDYSETGVTALM